MPDEADRVQAQEEAFRAVALDRAKPAAGWLFR